MANSLDYSKRKQTMNIVEEQKTNQRFESPPNYNSNTAMLGSSSTVNPYINKNSNHKSALADPDSNRQGHSKNKSDVYEEPKRQAIFFKRYACLCPGTISLEVALRSNIFR